MKVADFLRINEHTCPPLTYQYEKDNAVPVHPHPSGHTEPWEKLPNPNYRYYDDEMCKMQRGLWSNKPDIHSYTSRQNLQFKLF